MTTKGLRQALTISAIVLTLSSPTMPIIVNAAVETPTVETPTVETPTVETPTVETPAVETPAVETPAVETPAVETPAVETPAVETPTVETPTVETSKKITSKSSITYTDDQGQHILDVPAESVVNLTATSTIVTIKFDGQSYSLSNVTNLLIKGITVSNLIGFYSNTVVKLELDDVHFEKGIGISGPTNLQEVIVTNSKFGSTDYSFSVYSSQNLKKVQIDNSEFNADLRIYSNSSLENSQISNSIMKKNVTQYSNKKGYYTEFSNNVFERSTSATRTIASGGMSANDIFYINKNGTNIGKSKFNAAKDGAISYKDSAGVSQSIIVPAGSTVTNMTNTGNKIALWLSNGQKFTLDNIKDLNLFNVNIRTIISFVQSGLKLDALTIKNSKTQLIDIAYSSTLKEVNIIGTEISQSSGYLSIYNNSALNSIVIQDSSVKGTSGYMSIYNNKAMNKFILNNVYAYGYLSAYNLGGTIIQVSNSRFDDYINTNQIIKGEGEYTPVGELPVINGTDDITIKQGTTFDAMSGVTATDAEDGDLTSKITYSGEVNIDKIGVYTVIYTVIDSDGNTNNSSRTVTVTPSNIEQTTINELTTDSTEVGGTAEPNADISIKVGTAEIGKGKVGSDGKYSITIPKQAAGVTVKAIATLNSASSETSTVVKSVTAGTITPATYKVGNANITGTYTGDVAKVILKKNGVVQNPTSGAGTFSGGNFQYWVGNTIKDTDVLTLTAVDKDGKVLQADVPVIIEKNTAGTITPAHYKIGNANITGIYTGDVAKAILKKNGVVQNPTSGAGTFSGGNFQYWVGNTIKDTDVLTLTAVDKDGKVLQADIPVIIEKNTVGTITPARYKIDNANIIGTYTGDVAKAILKKNGVVQNPTSGAGTFSGGNFQYWVGNTIKDTDVLTLTAVDKDGKVLQADVPVIIEKNTVGTVTPAKYTIADANITGTYTGDVKKAQLFVNDKSSGWGGTFSGGRFTFYAVGAKIKPGDKVVLVAYDANDKELAREKVMVEAAIAGAITSATYKIGNGNITGTFTGDVARVQLKINGDNVGIPAGTFNSNGTFSYWAKGLDIKASDDVTLTALDVDNNQLQESFTVVLNDSEGNISEVSYKVGDANITGKYTGDVTRVQLKINGDNVGIPAGTFNSNGTFSYWAKNLNIQVTDEVRLDALGNQNNVLQAGVAVTIQE